MDSDQNTSFESGTSFADVKSPASDSGSVDSFGGSSIFDGIDELSLDLGPEDKEANTSQGNASPTSESKLLSKQDLIEVIDLTEENEAPVSDSESAKQDSVESEEEPEAPYTVGFTIPSPPPPVNGIWHDPPLHWTHKLYRGSQDQPVQVHYCTDFDTAETLAKEFLNEKVVGFDMEWEPRSTANSPIKKQISLIQVAAEAKIAIFHIARFEGGNSTKELIPSSLKTLIESPEIMKTGVAVHSADGTRITRVLELQPKGLIELSHFFNILQDNRNADGSFSKKSKSMAIQVKAYLKYDLPKGKVRTSSWSSPLRAHQIDYAAADAYAGLMLYHVMNEKRKMMRPTPAHPPFAELGLPVPGVKEKSSDANENASSKVEDTVMANTDTEPAPEAAAASGPESVSLNGPEAAKTQQEDDLGQESAKEASEHLLSVLFPSEPCLKGLRVGFTGGFTCLSRDQLAILASRCGAKVNARIDKQEIVEGLDLIVVGPIVGGMSAKRGQLLHRLIPAMAETDFYNMIRNRNRVDYPTIEKLASWQGESLEVVLGTLVEEARRTLLSTHLSKMRHGTALADKVVRACGWTIGTICFEDPKPRTVIELRHIEGGLFLYTLLKENGHDLIQVIRAFDKPASQEVLAAETL
ncbi:ribonuclease H-like domain-containing protein [Phyllosticta capitalensis]